MKARSEISPGRRWMFTKGFVACSNNCVVVNNALSYIAVIHDDTRNTEEWRKTMLERATNQCMTKDTRAESFYGLGVNYWQCSYDQTTRYQDKALFNTDQFHYRKMDYSPEALADRQKAQACVTKAFEYFEKALEIDPEYTQAMFYKVCFTANSRN